jgi:Putative adhesin
MKTLRIGFFFLAMTLSASRLLAQAGETQQLVVPLSEPGKPYTLDVHVMHGNIKVVGYEGKDLIIDIIADTTTHKGESQNGMKRLGGGESLDFTAQENNNTVNVSAGLSHGLRSVTIKVPQTNAKLKLGSIDQGDVTVNNVSGEIEVNNLNGNVTLTGISGSVVASNLSGNVIVDFKTVDPKAPMAFTTLSGKIDVTLPADTKINLKLKSDNGQMYSDFDVAVDATKPRVNKTSEDHYYKISIDDWIFGKINGGGPEMMMKSMSGNIYIRKAK